MLELVTRLHFRRDTIICPLAQLYTFTTHMLNLIYYFMKSVLLWDTGLFTYPLPWIAVPPWRQQGQDSYFCLEGRHPGITWITEDSISPIIQDSRHTVQLEWLYLILGNMTLSTAARLYIWWGKSSKHRQQHLLLLLSYCW